MVSKNGENSLNFIRLHIIRSIYNLYYTKKVLLEKTTNNKFFYFDRNLILNGKRIDRFGNNSLFYEEELLPISWHSIPGDILYSVYNIIKDNKFYVLRNIGGRNYKVRLKKDSIIKSHLSNNEIMSKSGLKVNELPF